MFFDSVKLKRTGWYVHVLNFVFPNAPKYSNFCPFFWLTVISLILSPFKSIYVLIKYIGIGLYFVGKVLFYAIDKIGNKVFDWIEKIALSNLEQDFNSFTPEDVAKARMVYYNHYFGDVYRESLPVCERKRYINIWKIADKIAEKLGNNVVQQKWSSADEKTIEEWKMEREKSLAQKNKEERERIIELNAQREKREIASKKLYAKVIKVGKFVVPVIVAPPAIFIGYYIVRFLGWLLYWIMYFLSHVSTAILDFFWNNGSAILHGIEIIVPFMIVVSLFIYYGVPAIYKFIKKNIYMPQWLCKAGQAIAKLFVKIINSPRFNKWIDKFGNGVLIVAKAIGSVFSFFWIFAKNFKNNNCPHIDWTD